jgi:DNA cross-link repair 1A protein
MFRNATSQVQSAVSATGRAPTPPGNESKSPSSAANTSSIDDSGARSQKTNKSSIPTLGRQPAGKISSVKKKPQNQSILNFFGKSDKTTAAAIEEAKADAGLFFDDSSRFNEFETPSKRRRTSIVDKDDDLFLQTPPQKQQEEPVDELLKNTTEEGHSKPNSIPKKAPKHRGGFVDESSDEDSDSDTVAPAQSVSPHGDDTQSSHSTGSISHGPGGDTQDLLQCNDSRQVPLRDPDNSVEASLGETCIDTVATDQPMPILSRENTSMFGPGDFEESEDYNDEFYDEGEEYQERKWMEEQRELEMEMDEDSKSESDEASNTTPRDESKEAVVLNGCGDSVATCPLCSGSLRDLSEAQASSHVNACLDGTATPLPKPDERKALVKDEPAEDNAIATQARSTTPLPGNQYIRKAAVPRPAQHNPFASTKDGNPGKSAFSRLMSGHAEDAAWAEAAQNENKSRGKPAYERTCPFYKIMPGMYIAVDAFRYGKVEGQNAYFLSHFHSDHYIGLTSSWCHGPIYASKVTCNLMRQQLRVAPKWLVPLEFNKKVEVPNTKGVFVTMIPANHCPGSSLYLFEKVIGKNKDNSPRLNRVLHCGDFRACPAHIAHPLLRPDIIDTVTGKTKEQTIDTCYLDTTYLTPKYSFPGQQDVIDACSQMCVSLAKDIPESSDAWEKAKLARAGSTMTKFLEAGAESTAAAVKNDPESAVEEVVKPKVRGRLLVVIGTYSIGKERICLGIAKALGSKIFAPPAKMKICACLEDPELNALLTSNPYEAQVHMQTLMEIRAETLHDYLVTYHGHFQRVVGFRPTGWSYRPPGNRSTDNPAVGTVLHSEGWKSRFMMKDLTAQRGSTKEAHCFGVPYSEHSSFRELTMFCCALRIGRVVPTVNVGSAKSRERMKGWIEKWEGERKKNGLYKVEAGEEGWGSGGGGLREGV